MSAIPYDNSRNVAADKNPFRLDSWPTALAIIAIGLLQLWLGDLNCNVSWFITFAEKALDGARVYQDIGDPNPPAAFLLYTPAVLLERASGVKAEFFVVAQTLLATGLSLAFAGAILRKGWTPDPFIEGALRNLSLFLFFLTPAYCFGEREHYAVLGLLPLLAVYGCRAARRPVALSAALGAGVLAGLVMGMKPHFGLAILCAQLATMWSSGRWRCAITPENGMTAGVFAAVLGATAYFYPGFFEYGLPLAVEVYAQARHSALKILLNIGAIAFFIMAAMAFMARRQAGPLARAAAAAAVGFYLIYVIQGKLWIYQAYPAIALMALALGLIWLEIARRDRASGVIFFKMRLAPVLFVAPFIFGLATNLKSIENYPGLTAGVRQALPPSLSGRPKIAALAEDMTVAFPLVRHVGGEWVGRQNALWRLNCVDQILAASTPTPERRARLIAYAKQDVAELIADIRASNPDILLIGDESVRARHIENPEFAAILAGFERVGVYSEVEVWRARRAGV